MNLNEMDTNDLVKLFQETQSGEVFKELEERHIKMIRKLANKFTNQKNPNFEDYVSLGLECLYLSALGYKTELGKSKFSTYLHRAIFNRFLQTFQREQKRDIVDFSLNATYATSDKEDQIMDTFIVEDSEFSLVEIILARDIMNNLGKYIPKEKHRQVFIKRFIEGKSLQEVGDELGITRQRAQQIMSKNIKVLKNIFMNAE